MKPFTYFAVQVVISIVKSSQFSLMSFAYKVTPSGKESSQSFKVGVAIVLEEGKCCWYKDCRLVRVHDVFLDKRSSDTFLDEELRSRAQILALNRRS